MNKRRFIVLASILGVTLVGFVFVRNKSRGPSYQGRSVSTWFEEYVRTAGNSPDARQAFCAMGEPAVSFLTRHLTEKSALRDKYVTTKPKMPSLVFNKLPVWKFPYWAQRQYAAKALGEVGPAASNAVPSLMVAVNQSELETTTTMDPVTLKKEQVSGGSYLIAARVEAIRALGKITPGSAGTVTKLCAVLRENPFFNNRVDEAVLDVLADFDVRSNSPLSEAVRVLKDRRGRFYLGQVVAALNGYRPGFAEEVPRLIAALKNSNPSLREAAAYELGTVRPEAREVAKQAIPSLIESLNESNSAVRLNAAEAILNLDSAQVSPVIPAMIDLLLDNDPFIRLRAVEVLRRIGPEARAAVPALTQCLHDEAKWVRVWAKEALKVIEPSTVPTSRKP